MSRSPSLAITPRDELLSLRETAARLRASLGYTYSLVTRGELPYIELPSRSGRRRGRILIKVTDLAAFIEKHRKTGHAA